MRILSNSLKRTLWIKFSIILITNFSFGIYTKKLDIDFSSQTFIESTTSSNISFHYGSGGISLSYAIKSIFNGTEAFVSWVDNINDNLIIATANPNNIYSYIGGKLENIGSVANHSMITKLKVIDNSLFMLTGGKGSIYLLSFLNTEPLVTFENGYIWDVFKFNNKYYAISGNKPGIYEVSKNFYKPIFETESEKHFLVALVDNDKVYIGSSGTGSIYTFNGYDVKPFISLKESEITDIKKYKNFLIVSTYNVISSSQTQQGTSQQESKATQVLPINLLRNTKGNVYKIDINTKRIETLFSEVGITSLEIVDNKLFATTIDGKLVEYSLDENKFKSSFYGRNFLKIFRFGKDLYISSANPSGLDIINLDQIVLTGYLETKEIDVGKVDAWGRIKYDGNIPSSTSVSIFIKGGNTPKEDTTWSDWTEVKEFITLDKYQYVKIKVILSSKNPKVSPLLKSISLLYTPKNSKPEISSFTVSQQGELLNFEWKSSDPDNDKLRYRLFVRNYNENVWQILNRDPITDTKFSINKYFIGNGIFSFMLIADDSLTNPKGFEIYTTNFIENYTVDASTPYVNRESINVKRSEKKVTLEFKISDNTSLKEVQYSIDGINWNYLLPLDGVIDSSLETFRIDLENETRVVLLKITDEFGNTITERISF
ncbi:MAG: hypothetical protein ABDH28_04635 [Brevinematia bacterium]